MKSDKHSSAGLGQGLVEYALLLMLVAIVLVAAVTIYGKTLGETFCRINAALPGSTTGSCDVEITRSDYDSSLQELHLHATVNGGYDPAVTMTAAPGGVMQAAGDHYHLRYTLSGCPCTVTVTSSSGGSASVTVGP